jgi:disulfide bond formation protein DsbB
MPDLKLSLAMVAILMSATVVALAACGESTSTDPNTQTISSTPKATASSGVALSPEEAGNRAYQSSCLACHGIDATGIPGLGKTLVESTFVQGLSDDELVTFIKNGRSSGDPLNTTGIDMPAKGGNSTLSDADIRAIIAWLRSIQE